MDIESKSFELLNRLKPLDIEFMKNLHEKVNIIPIIAKADALSEEERKSMKQRVLQDLSYHNISLYEVNVDPADNEQDQKQAKEYRVIFFFFFFSCNPSF